MSLSEVGKWLYHLTSCSPCYRDFSQFRIADRNRRTRTRLAIAATIVMVACFAGWALFLRQTPTLVLKPKEPPPPRQEEPLVTVTAVINLEGRSPVRGPEQPPPLPPLKMPRNVSHLEIVLPLASQEGLYDVLITTPQGESVLVATGTAKLKRGITSFGVDVLPSPIRQGRYIFNIRKRSWDGWYHFPLVVQ
jgi:hypothetical protein